MDPDERIGELETQLANALETIENLQRIASDLNRQVVELKQTITRLEVGEQRQVWPWKAE